MTWIYDNVHPDEIAETICKNAENYYKNDYDEDDKKSITECLYWVKSAAENPQNPDYWRVFYKSLQDLHYAIECGY